MRDLARLRAGMRFALSQGMTNSDLASAILTLLAHDDAQTCTEIHASLRCSIARLRITLQDLVETEVLGTTRLGRSVGYVLLEGGEASMPQPVELVVAAEVTDRANATMERIEFEPEELDVAMQWHGGQSSMLYAMASTGALARGVERCRPRVDCDACGGAGRHFVESAPRGVSPWRTCEVCRGAKMTDDQWLAHLASKLEGEAEERRDTVRDSHWEGGEASIEALESIVRKCREAIAKLGGAS